MRTLPLILLFLAAPVYADPTTAELEIALIRLRGRAAAARSQPASPAGKEYWENPDDWKTGSNPGR